MSLNEFSHFLGKALDAKRRGHEAWAVQSTGEKVAVALVLNRADWLAEMEYTLAEAIDRTGLAWLSLVPAVAKALQFDDWSLEERLREVEACTRALRNVLALPDTPSKAPAIEKGRQELMALVGADRQAFAEAVARAEGAAAVLRASANRED